MTTTTENNRELTDKKELIHSDEFEKALESAANLKKENLTSYKERNKDNYMRFYDIMVTSDRKIQDILDTKKRNRTDDDNNRLKDFKKDVSQTYKQVCDLMLKEDLEDGELTKVQKIVHKVAKIVKMMDYLGNHEIDDEFKKFGIDLKYDSLEKNEVFQNETIKTNVKDIFSVGMNIKKEMTDNNDAIKDNIYVVSVPTDLQYDKNTNPTGLKASDFAKLVDIKTKAMMANTDEQKEKVEETANNLAGDYVFANVRNSLIQSKLIGFVTEEEK